MIHLWLLYLTLPEGRERLAAVFVTRRLAEIWMDECRRQGIAARIDRGPGYLTATDLRRLTRTHKTPAGGR